MMVPFSVQGSPVRRLVSAAAFLVVLLPAALLMALLPSACCSASANSPTEENSEYQQLLEENSQNRSQIEELEAALQSDEELEASVLTYADSLEANPEFAQQETSLNEAYDEDPVLLERQTELDEAAAEEADADVHLTALDSLMAADPDFAERVAEVERLAGEDESLLDTHGEAMAYLESHPEEAEALFAEEVQPTYTGSDPVMIAYAGYLVAHPPLYRAWWRLYHHLRIHPRYARSVYVHWRWYHPRARLWRASWAYKLRAARNARIHKVVWDRRIYMGQHAQLARSIWHHRRVVAARPALRTHVRFLRHNPRFLRSVCNHRRWVHRHHPHATKPPLRVAKSHPKSPPPKRKPPKRR